MAAINIFIRWYHLSDGILLQIRQPDRTDKDVSKKPLLDIINWWSEISCTVGEGTVWPVLYTIAPEKDKNNFRVAAILSNPVCIIYICNIFL